MTLFKVSYLLQISLSLSHTHTHKHKHKHKQCNGPPSKKNLTYAWTVALGTVPVHTLLSESKDTSKFLLSPYRLTIGSLYTVTVTVFNTESMKSAAASVQVLALSSVKPSVVLL